jgi:hypothetical protein
MADSQPGVSEKSVEQDIAYSTKILSSGIFFYLDRGPAVKMTRKMC